MWEPFTDEVRTAVMHAGDKARDLNHSQIGTGHILYSILVYQENSVGLEALRESTDVNLLKSDLEHWLSETPKSKQKEPEGGYTVIVPALKGCVTYGETIEKAADAAKEAIELTFQEAFNMGHTRIGTEHLVAVLFGPLDVEATPYDVAHEVLRKYTNINGYRREMRKILGIEEAPNKEKVPYDQYIGKIVYVRDSAAHLIGVLSSVKGSSFKFQDPVNLNHSKVKSAERAFEIYNDALPMLKKLAEKGVKHVYSKTSEIMLSRPKIHCYELAQEVSTP